MARELNVALVGFGLAGSVFHAPLVACTPGLRLHTVVSRDPAKVRAIDHSGSHFQVRGPLNVPRSPQGRPVVVQAGSSEGGKALGSRHADAIFTTQTTLEGGIAFYNEMKNRARAWGRDPDHIKIMPGLSTVIGSTEEEARRRCDELDSYQGEDGLANQIAQRIGGAK